MNFSLLVATASLVHVTAQFSRNGTRQHVELSGQLSAVRWDDLTMLASPLQQVLATVFGVPVGSIEQRYAICGDLPLLEASIELRVNDVDEEQLPAAAQAVTSFIGNVVANASGAPLFTSQAIARPDVDAIVDKQGQALLDKVGGKVVRTKIHLRSPHVDSLVVSGRWARLPQGDATISEEEMRIEGYADGFLRGQRSLFLLDRSGRPTHLVHFEERLFLEEVIDLCAKNRLDARPGCTLIVRRRAEGDRFTYVLRGIEFHGMKQICEAQPDFVLAAESSAATEQEAAMA
jgi:hypothetical protein